MTRAGLETPAILVCFAVREEARFFKPLSCACRVVVGLTGMGQDNAARAVRRLVDRHNPASLLTCGFAGALNPGLPRGTVVFSGDDHFGLGEALADSGARPARFRCSSRILVTREEKRRVWESTQADAVEMESEIIRQFCHSRGIPSATIRVISDAADEDLPIDFNALMTRSQRLNYWRLAAELALSPGKIKDLLALRRNTTAAARQLAACLQLVLERQAR